MGKRSKSKAEIEAELKQLRRSKLTSSATEIVLNLIRYGSLVLIALFAREAIADLAGKTTQANVFMQVLSDINVGWGVAALLGVGGTLYGMAERKQRQRMIERLHGRTKILEQKIDPKRSSSGITESGDTNPLDY
jgi:hypothetical protein